MMNMLQVLRIDSDIRSVQALCAHDLSPCRRWTRKCASQGTGACESYDTGACMSCGGRGACISCDELGACISCGVPGVLLGSRMCTGMFCDSRRALRLLATDRLDIICLCASSPSCPIMSYTEPLPLDGAVVCDDDAWPPVS
jgi:hypothetical protein